jgi:hypothetical protein
VRSASAADRGSVTAEFVVLVPAVLMVLACCLGGLSLVGAQLRLQDAAAQAARSAARGGGVTVVGTLVPDASVARHDRGDLACVTVSASGGLGVLGAIGLEASSCALSGGR